MRTVRILMKAVYVCRGCGTEITTPNSYIRCPVCGIKYN